MKYLNLLPEIEKAYRDDINYFEGEIEGQMFKIRMNKNHARNSHRNDDQCIHNLSLVSENDITCRVFRKSITGKYQRQIENIRDWEDAEEAISDFLFDIEKDFCE